MKTPVTDGGTLLGDRLRKAIENWGSGSIREFQRVMAEADVRGHSYQMIHKYLSGDREPSLEVLRGAAGVLRVPLEWLILGTGPETLGEDAVLRVLQDRPGMSDDELLGGGGPRLGPSPAVEDLLHDTIAQYVSTAGDIDELDDEEAHQAFRDIWWLCNLPRSLWGFRFALPPREVDDYMLSMLLALRRVILPPGKERSKSPDGSLIRKLQAVTEREPKR